LAVVTITVAGRPYEIGCDDSQVSRIEALGKVVDGKAQDLLRQVGTIPDPRLLAMVGLMLADELDEARSQLRQAGSDLDTAAQGDEALAKGIESLAERIETIAERLERS
jgi:cell division protein ZapA